MTTLQALEAVMRLLSESGEEARAFMHSYPHKHRSTLVAPWTFLDEHGPAIQRALKIAQAYDSVETGEMRGFGYDGQRVRILPEIP